MTIPFWINEPNILFKKEYITELYPKQNMTFEQKLNAISRLVLLLSILLFLIIKNWNILLIGFLTLGILYSIYNIRKNQIIKSLTSKNKEQEEQAEQSEQSEQSEQEEQAEQSEQKEQIYKEGFSNFNNINNNNYENNENNKNNETKVSLNNVLKNDFYNSNKRNPMGNVLLTEINDNPERKAAAPSYNPEVYEKINKDVKKQTQMLYPSIKNTNQQIYGDLYDNYVFDRQFMQRFYSTPNTRVTNDQGAFSQYLYGGMYSGKESTPEGAIMRMKDNYRYILI